MLEKNYNFYVIDDVFDDKFASDFTIQYLDLFCQTKNKKTKKL